MRVMPLQLLSLPVFLLHGVTTIPTHAGISAGVIAGLLGLGGGLVLAPLMLELGVQPSVAAASTQVRLSFATWVCCL